MTEATEGKTGVMAKLLIKYTHAGDTTKHRGHGQGQRENKYFMSNMNDTRKQIGSE